jgi:3-keto-5-aminohexanoate cleavage enzyme
LKNLEIHDGAPMAAPLIISVAPNGARRSKLDHPAIPLSSAEIAEEAGRCADAGASLLHLHVRDADGRHSLSPDAYRGAIDRIHARVGDRLLVQITTESCGIFQADEQMAAVLTVKPAAASFALREFIAASGDEPRARDFFAAVKELGTQPQFILYEPAEIDRLRELMAAGVIPFAAPSVLFVLGRYPGGPSPEPSSLVPFLARWGRQEAWTACSFGPAELRVAAAAIALGGHVRVGFENNLQRPDGSYLASTAEQVTSVAALARLLHRPIYSAAS